MCYRNATSAVCYRNASIKASSIFADRPKKDNTWFIVENVCTCTFCPSPAGILQTAADILFQGPELRRPHQLQAVLTCFEVCGTNCFDLLDGGERLIVREVSNTKVEVRSPMSCWQLC
jgi:hypothetical protein